jgi:hypothetical protein
MVRRGVLLLQQRQKQLQQLQGPEAAEALPEQLKLLPGPLLPLVYCN